MTPGPRGPHGPLSWPDTVTTPPNNPTPQCDSLTRTTLSKVNNDLLNISSVQFTRGAFGPAGLKGSKTYPSHDLNGEVMEHGPQHHGHDVGVVPDEVPAAL